MCWSHRFAFSTAPATFTCGILVKQNYTSVLKELLITLLK